MRQEHFAGRFGIDDEISLRSNMVGDTFLLFLPVLTYNESKVQIGNGAEQILKRAAQTCRW